MKIKTQKALPNIRNKGVNIAIVNTRSICGPSGKTEDFLDHAISSHLDLCFVTETFLTDRNTVTRAALHPSGYSFEDQPRLNGDSRGGMGVFYNNSFKAEKLDFGEKRSFEFVEWTISWQNVRLKVFSIYHIPYSQSHPVTDATFLEEIQDYFENIVLCNERLLIVGDFNLHIDDISDQYGKEFLDVLDSFGLVNHVWVPTHESGHTLDLIITRNNDEFSLSIPRARYFISDHCFVSSRLDMPRPNLQIKTTTSRQIREINMPDFQADLVDICTSLLKIDDIDTLAKEYNSQLSKCLDKHAPSITNLF